jgi:CO/xanthine dehydrogenase Mo-binding subunit
MTEEHTAEHWLGRSVKRKEDDRFLQGRGNYVDDINLPGMLYMSVLRSPVAHARINSIDTSAAEALPGVVAVVTGELLAQHNLAWMPTLSGDTQAVLATDKVRMQGQEVACVVAEDPYVAHDALELIEVDYDPLPVVITPQQSLEPGTTRKTSRTTASTTGRPATRRPPTGPSSRPTGWSASTPSTPAATRPRWRPAAAWPTSTRSPARSPST